MPSPRHLLLAACACALAAPSWAEGPLSTSFLYRLSSANGIIPFSGVRLSYDAAHHELYVIGEAGLIRIFNESGMEIFSFGDSPDLGTVTSVAATDTGEILTLSYFDGKPSVLRCNFRGERLGVIEMAGVPAEHQAFVPAMLRYASGRIYLADLAGMRFMVLEADGRFAQLIDAAKLLKLSEQERIDNGIKGFDVAADGTILFTVPPLFRAYVLSPSGKLEGFGQRGGAPGKFNVITGIATDEQGYIYIADILKSAVIAFDRNLRFVREFGYRGTGPGNLASPVDVAAGNGKVYVSQYARRGVSVFQVRAD